MSRLDYPTALPCPQAIQLAPLERRQLSTASRPREARAQQLDRAILANVTWPPMTAQQIGAWRAWWRDTLVYGAASFNATWPIPEGQVEAVWQFLATPQRSFVPGGLWIVSAPMEVRGVSLAVQREPLPIFLLHLDGNFTDEMGATFAVDGPPGTNAPGFVASAAGFDQQATCSDATLVRALYPGAQRLVDASEWQFDAFVTPGLAPGGAQTVVEISSNDNAGTQRRLLWVNLFGLGDGSSAQLDVRIRTALGLESTLSTVDVPAATILVGERAHVRVTQKNGAVLGYVNGVLCKSFESAVFTAVAGTFTQVTLGASLAGFSVGNNFYSAYMRGQIDEFRFCQEVTNDGNFDPPIRPFTVPIG